MKIAFVNQPFDVITPPFQSSIGAYTYGVTRALARDAEVLVYGLRESHSSDARASCGPDLDLRLVPASRTEQAVFKVRRKLGEMVQISSPVSTSELLFPQYGRRVAEDLRREECDVIHIQHCSQYVPVIRALNPRAKIILQMHAEWFSQSNYKVLEYRLGRVDLLLTVSDHIARKTTRQFPAVAERCHTVYCGVDPEEFQAEKDYRVGRQRSMKRILYAGAVSPHKGPHVLLEAFRSVVKRYPDAELEFVGGLSNYPLEETFDLQDHAKVEQVAPFYRRSSISRLQARLGWAAPDAGTYQGHLKAMLTPEIAEKVTFTGFLHRSDFVRRYYEADVFVFPPIWEEGFGIPPVEAMAAGLPVVGSRSGALPETVLDGETGFLVAKNDPEALAERIVQLLHDDDLRERMGRAGRRRALERFTWQRAADGLAAQYRRLAQRSVNGSRAKVHAMTMQGG